MMRILYVGAGHGGSDPAVGPSAGPGGFPHALLSMGLDLDHFDAAAHAAARGPAAATRRLRELVDAQPPDLLFSVLAGGELERRGVRHISDATPTPTCNWFGHDPQNFSYHAADWAPCFNHVVTTDPAAMPKYRSMRGVSASLSQWAATPCASGSAAAPPAEHDLSFVGTACPGRRAVVEVLRNAGLKVDTFGPGWDRGPVSPAQMAEIFRRTKINLNLSRAASVTGANAATDIEDDPLLHRLARLPQGGRYAAGIYRRYRRIRQTLRPARRRDLGPGDIDPGPAPRPNARTFEVPACGGFLLTRRNPALKDHYEDGPELATFATAHELIERARHFLAHDEERCAVAAAGHARTLNEHTWAHRLHPLFTGLGLDVPPLARLLAPPQPGTLREFN